MKNFTITSPIITIETEAEKALINKLYPRATIMDTRHALLPDAFTIDELIALKTKLADPNRFMLEGKLKYLRLWQT